MIFQLILLSLLSVSAMAASPNLCDLLDIKNCSGVSKQGRRSSLLSLPSPSTAALLNPATVSFDRGVGLEIIHQNNNPDIFNLATGTGKIGGALISTSLENAFFGNRVEESEAQFIKRYRNKKQFKSKKISLSLGGKVFHRKNLSLDLGVILKRHSEIKKVHAGVGTSLRIGMFTVGASRYEDDVYLDPDHRIFQVTTLSVGTKLGDFGIDYGMINSRYKDSERSTDIKIFSGSYQYQHVLFNLAYRHEDSPAPEYTGGPTPVTYSKTKSDVFAGVQLSLGRHLIVGINYNYFLLREMSFSASLFF